MLSDYEQSFLAIHNLFMDEGIPPATRARKLLAISEEARSCAIAAKSRAGVSQISPALRPDLELLTEAMNTARQEYGG